MDVNLNFLKNVKLKPIEVLAPTKRIRVPKLPGDDVSLRVFANGKIYPSKAFAKEMDLEYQDRKELSDGSYAIYGNGLDIFSSKQWDMYPDNAEEHYLFAAVVPKAFAKVSVFSSTKYQEDNTPKNSVLTQGFSAFTKTELLDMLTDVYGINWDIKEYVDLVFVNSPVESETGIYHIPKLVTSGKKKGEHTFIRRDKIDICPLVPKETVMNTPVKDAEEILSESTPEVSDEATDEGAKRVAELPFPDSGAETTATTDWSKLGS